MKIASSTVIRQKLWRGTPCHFHFSFFKSGKKGLYSFALGPHSKNEIPFQSSNDFMYQILNRLDCSKLPLIRDARTFFIRLHFTFLTFVIVQVAWCILNPAKMSPNPMIRLNSLQREGMVFFIFSAHTTPSPTTWT